MQAGAQQVDINSVVSALLRSIAQGGPATPQQQQLQNELLRLLLQQQVQMMQAQNIQVPPSLSISS